MRTIHFFSSLLLGSLGIQAQEWHYLSPTNGNIPANAYAVAFSIGGLGYFATGSTNAVSGGFVSGAIYSHDPATNTVSFHSGGVYPPRTRATAFVVGGYAYIGLGNDATGGAGEGVDQGAPVVDAARGADVVDRLRLHILKREALGDQRLLNGIDPAVGIGGQLRGRRIGERGGGRGEHEGEDQSGDGAEGRHGSCRFLEGVEISVALISL